MSANDILAEASAIVSAVWKTNWIDPLFTSYTLAFDQKDGATMTLILAAAEHDEDLMENISEFHCEMTLNFEQDV